MLGVGVIGRSRVAVVSITAAGAALARQLPYEHRQPNRQRNRAPLPDDRQPDGEPQSGGLAAEVAVLWAEVDGLVLVCATGIAVRVIAPFLASKHTDPPVVCLDDGGRWAIALAGGHHGANELVREVASLVGAEPVVTTASDAANDVVPLDALPGFTARGDVAGVTRAWLDGAVPHVDRTELPDWPLPPALSSLPGPERPHGAGETADIAGEGRQSRIRVTDGRSADDDALSVTLHPPSLVLGVGSSSGADPDGLAELVDKTLAGIELSVDAVGLVVSIDLKASEPAVVALADRLGVALRTFPAELLAAVNVPHPSAVVEAAVGTPSVAEAAALAAAGPQGVLVVGKRRSSEATVAVARRVRPEGHLSVVGLGPGGPAWRTPAAVAALRSAQVVVGYGPYIDLAGDLLAPHQEQVRSPIGAETDRCVDALERAAGGAHVALVCSGDPGVYAMASLVCELAPTHGNPPVTVVPGVTAALAAAALLGAPLGHDHASVSLSDLLTPWEVIDRRLDAVAAGDLVVSLYNPRSRRRTWQLERAVEILGKHRPLDCPVAVATDVGRPGQRIVRTTLGQLDPDEVDMLSLVMVGSSTTRWVAGRMVTPRGYSGTGASGSQALQAAGGGPA